jgi:hypothetical protein
MDAFRLDVQTSSYALHLGGRLIARLDGGAAALIPGAAAQLRELDIENAIERSEDWLMPFSKSLQGCVLLIRDATGRIASTLGGRTSLTVDEIENAFTIVHDAVACGQPAARDAVADIVLLRELAHHGRLARVCLA